MPSTKKILMSRGELVAFVSVMSCIVLAVVLSISSEIISIQSNIMDIFQLQKLEEYFSPPISASFISQSSVKAQQKTHFTGSYYK
jgi:hypothetical protein